MVHRSGEGSVVAALRLCSGAHLALMSDEDEWLPGHVGSLLETMQADSAAAAYAETILHVSTPFRAAGADGEIRKAWFACTDDVALTPEAALRRLPLGAIMFRADLLDAGYFDAVPIGTAEDARLLFTVLSKARPASSGRLTSIAVSAPGHVAPAAGGARSPTPRRAGPAPGVPDNGVSGPGGVARRADPARPRRLPQP